MKWGYILYGVLFAVFISVAVLAVMLSQSAAPTPTLPSAENIVHEDDVVERTPSARDIFVNDTPNEAVERLLNTLPVEIEESGRTILFDRETVPTSSRSAFAALPYEMTVGGEVSVIESSIELRPTESPFMFTERFVAQRLPGEDDLARYGEEVYETAASFYRTEGSEAGVSAYVRRMNLPDDAVGGREDRFDFIRTGSSWRLVWLGERTYCRRRDNEFWQPADRLCP